MTTARDGSAERGAAYLFLMILLGAMASLLAIQLGQLVPPQAVHRGVTEERLARIRDAAIADYAQNGVFAADLATLAAQARLPTTGDWRLDPYGSVADFRWQVTGQPRTLSVDSRGIDGRFGNADDLSFLVSEQSLGRDRSRDRLRVLRAGIVDWQAGVGGTAGPGAGHANPGNRGRGRGRAPGNPMSAADRASLRQSSRAYALARREYLTAGSARRAVLTTTMSDCLTTIRALRTRNGITFPTQVTGANGLMEQVGWPDSVAVDGWNRVLLWDEAVGVTSRGGDNLGGTDDDF